MEKKIKDYLGIVVIIALLAFGYAVLSYANTYSKAAEPSSFRSFAVSGEGKVVAVPDVAQFTFSVITEGDINLDATQIENTTNTNKAIDFVKGQGVDDKDIRTQSYNVDPRYQRFTCDKVIGFGGLEPTPCPPPEIVGYTIRQVVSVKIRDFETIGDVVSGTVENGANSVSQLNFTIDDPAEIESEARTRAVDQAQDKAKDIARAGGFRLGKLLSIDEGVSYPVSYRGGFGDNIDFAESALLSVPTPSIEPGSQDVQINVTLRYEIK